MGADAGAGWEGKSNAEPPQVTAGFYEDIATLAWPATAEELADDAARFTVSASDPETDLTVATDGEHEGITRLNAPKNGEGWVQFSYEKPFTLRSLYLLCDGKPDARLQTSDDGKHWADAAKLGPRSTGKHEYAISFTHAGLSARYFRVVTTRGIDLREISLSAIPLMPDWLGRSSLARTEDRVMRPLPGGASIDPKQMIDLSGQVDQNGYLKAELPEGNWTVMRFGYTSTGAVNIPASAAGRGLEADKLRREPLKIHYDAYVRKVVKASPPGSVGYVEIDSYEVGGQNWTQGFQDTFRAEYGYDLIPFMPLFAGRLIGSAEVADRVQRDLRNLVGRLLNDHYYGYFTELANADGLQTYVEPYGGGPLNNLAAGGRADIPMGEFWLKRPSERTYSAVSAARTYGKNIVSAEAFTAFDWAGNWGIHPAEMKADNDLNWTKGFNEYVFHRFAHQPNTNVTPGMTMNRWGVHYDRTQTWWYNAGKAFNEYIARGQYLLRQGVPVSDVLVFVGDGSPNGIIERDKLSVNLPWYHNYDCVNNEVLQGRLGADAGAMKLPEGTTYRILLLENSRTMTLATLKKLKELGEAGVPIFGKQPVELMGHQTTEADRQTFAAMVREIWSMPNVKASIGKETFSDDYSPDLTTLNNEELQFVHRKAGDTDIYFLYNPGEDTLLTTANFRVTDKDPEFWQAMDGSVQRTALFVPHSAGTFVDITLAPKEGRFVIFNKGNQAMKDPIIGMVPRAPVWLNPKGESYLKASSREPYKVLFDSEKLVSVQAESLPAEIGFSKPWSVAFHPAGGYGGTQTMTTLTDWKDHPLDSIRYFSGTATYTTKVEVPQEYFGEDRRLTLDLGKVCIAAEVRINGKDVQTLWHPPFTLDVTDYLHAGSNRLEIAVTNQWNNRLIGDERYPRHDDGYRRESYRNGNRVTKPMVDWYSNNEPLPPGPRTTFSTADFFKKDDPLVPSGLLGPVRLVPAQILPLAPASAPKKD